MASKKVYCGTVPLRLDGRDVQSRTEYSHSKNDNLKQATSTLLVPI